MVRSYSPPRLWRHRHRRDTQPEGQPRWSTSRRLRRTKARPIGDFFYRGQAHPQAPKLEPDAHGLVCLPRSAFADAFAQNASSAEQEVLAAVQRPVAATIMGVSVHRPLWKGRPSWFQIAEEDRMIAPETHWFMAAPYVMWNGIRHTVRF